MSQQALALILIVLHLTKLPCCFSFPYPCCTRFVSVSHTGRWKATTVAVKIIEHYGVDAQASSGSRRVSAGQEMLFATSIRHPNVVSLLLLNLGEGVECWLVAA